MRNVLFLFLGLSLFACKSEIQKNEAAIQELATNWETATNSVTEVNNLLAEDMNGFAAAAQGFILNEEAVASLKGDAATQYNEAMSAFRGATSEAYTPLMNELSAFVTEWTAKTADLTALTEGLKSGKYEGNVVESIATLTGYVTKASEFSTSISAKRNELKANADAAIEKLKMAFEAVAPKK